MGRLDSHFHIVILFKDTFPSRFSILARVVNSAPVLGHKLGLVDNSNDTFA